MFGMISDISTNLFRTFIIYKFLNTFFPEKKEIKGLKITYMLFFSVTMGMHFAFRSPWVNVGCNLVMLYLLTWFYAGDQKKKILVTLLVYGINFICDVLAVFVLSDYKVGEAYSQIAPYVTVFLIGICEYIIERFIIKKRRKNTTPPYWNILMLIPVISIVILHSMVVFSLNNQTIMITVGSGILIINLIIFFLYDALVETYERLQDNIVFERQIASYSHQLDVMMRTEEKITLLRHDMKHHLNELYRMAEHNRGREITEYIDHMQVFIENKEEHCRSGNKEMDSLLNFLLNKAQEVLGKVSYEINIPKELEIKTFDWNVILGNLLENAIYASQNTEDKYLAVEINYDRGMLFIRIQNSYAGKIEKEEESFLSTKTDRENHGIGLRSVKRVVDTYQGMMKIEHDNNMFEVRVTLYI